MASLSLTGKDIIKIGNRALFDLADGDVATVTFAKNIAELKTGKDGNSIYALNESGRQADMTVRVIRASNDDVYLNGLMRAQIIDFPTAIVITAQVTKRVGNGSGQPKLDTYILEGGVFQKQPDMVTNTDGNTDQAVTVYAIKFANAQRAIF